jgi:hypothetical protein
MADINVTISYEEVARLVEVIVQDPESWLHARIADWRHPASRTVLTLADVYDLLVAVNNTKKGKKPKPYPRPWTGQANDSITVGRKASQTQENIKAILARMSGRAKD